MNQRDQQTMTDMGKRVRNSSKSLPEISIIIVNWNSKDYVRQCLTSLFTHCRSVNFEVIVVDGASFDGCDEMLAREFPTVIFVQSPENVGFARANNLGAQHAAGQFLLLLNPDTLFLDDALKQLLDRLKSLSAAGAVGCRLLNADRTLQTSCVQAFPTVLNRALDSEYLRRRFPEWKLWGIAVFNKLNGGPAVVDAISGACILLPKAVFVSIGGFTEHYFMYGEDIDLCFKIKLSGRLVYFVPEAQLVHFGGGSTKQAASNFSTLTLLQSTNLFLRRNRGLSISITHRAVMSMTAFVRLLLIFPLMLVGDRFVRHGTNSLRKWFTVLRWSLGLVPSARAPITTVISKAAETDCHRPRLIVTKESK